MKQCVAHVKLGYGQLGLLLAYGQHRPSNAISRNELWSKIIRHTESRIWEPFLFEWGVGFTHC